MTPDEITRSEALTALAYTPFVLTILIAIAVAVTWTLATERAARNPYMGPWRDREPGELGGRRG